MFYSILMIYVLKKINIDNISNISHMFRDAEAPFTYSPFITAAIVFR